MQLLKRIEWMKLSLGLYVGATSFFTIGKKAEMDGLPIVSDRCDPFGRVFVPTYAKQIGGTSFADMLDILPILRLRGLAQICKRIVAFYAVNVVNVFSRPMPVNVEPSKPVGWIKFPINSDKGVSVGRTSCNIANSIATMSSNSDSARKQPTLRLVMQQLTKALCGKIGLSHDALLMLIGQRPASADNASGLRYFNVRGA